MLGRSISWLRSPFSVAGLVLGLCLALVATSGQWLGGSRRVEGRASIIDGDSLRIAGREVRLKGIDAPEGRQTCTRGGEAWSCGDMARRELRTRIAMQMVQCVVHEQDKHDRLLATCRAGGLNLNQSMVTSGMALSFGAYHREEKAARKAQRGLWSGEFERPQEWRRRNGIGN